MRACRSMQVEWLNAQTARVVKGWGSSLLKICNIFRSFVQTTSSYACWYTLCEFFFLVVVSPRDPFSWNYTYLCVRGSIFGMHKLSSFLHISPQVVVLWEES